MCCEGGATATAWGSPRRSQGRAVATAWGSPQQCFLALLIVLFRVLLCDGDGSRVPAELHRNLWHGGGALKLDRRESRAATVGAHPSAAKEAAASAPTPDLASDRHGIGGKRIGRGLLFPLMLCFSFVVI